jgi:hypothetical protein
MPYLPVISAVSATVGTVNIIKGWAQDVPIFLKEAKKTGKIFRELEASLGTYESRLTLWMEFWGLEEATSRKYQKELWGPEQLKILSHQMVEIRAKIEDIGAELLFIKKK